MEFCTEKAQTLAQISKWSLSRPNDLQVVLFGTDASPVCKHARQLVSLMAQELYSSAHFWAVDPHEIPSVGQPFCIESVPVVLLLRNGQELGRVAGFKPKEISSLIRDNLGTSKNGRIFKLVRQHHPFFSSGGDADLLLDWSHTYPSKLQVLYFSDGPTGDMTRLASKLTPEAHFWLVKGGERAICDHFVVESLPCIVLVRDGREISRLADEIERGILGAIENVPPRDDSLVRDKAEDSTVRRLHRLINQHPFMIFIKGTPKEPRCGFTKQLIYLLEDLSIDYEHFDILSDEEVRQGLKVLSDWPTYPQIYVRGELLGGLDILKEMIAEGKLEELL